ncbi:MAG: DNA topoisomerase IV subunit A [Lentisphaeria bacterium]|nr:DNA topoisomerase IV subunit A [Lentisphaeria bacterium]
MAGKVKNTRSSSAEGKKEIPENKIKKILPVSAETPEEDLSGEIPAEFVEEDPGETDDDSMQADAPVNERLRKMMDTNFIEYASYVIKDRAIPDVDDGLKPVQRRILWTLHQIDNGSYHKVQGVVGDTMKYHPHGDASIYEALVNLANKEYFIDKQGSFGSVILGTPAAAGRYIECRMGEMGREVLFNDDVTPLVDSYDGRNLEPVILPVKVPTLLMMGADGVAVGTKTKILPHNFKELLEAQIAILENREFHLYPDFIQGGIIDVSEYQDGLGKVLIRAKIEVDGRNLVIKEIPASTDSGKLTDTIVAAVEKNKIKIAKVNDYTAEEVNIQLQPIRGYDPVKALNALYTYTDCQMSVSCQPMVIIDNRPEKMTVSDILRRNTEKLVQFLSWELQVEAAKALDKILARTLAQIFIEEKIYKEIEKCKSKDAMFTTVRKALEKYEDEWLPLVQHLHDLIYNGPNVKERSKEEILRLEQLSSGIIPDAEIDRLVEIPIRRIAAFEIDRNRQEIADLRKILETAEKNLKNIRRYTIKYLQKLIDKYGDLFPRKTEVCLEGFGKINKAAAALNNIRVGWDKGNCYIGTHVKSDDIVLCNEFDHLLCITRKGDYKIIDIPDKIFIDRLYEFRKYDKNTVFGVVYSDPKTGKVYGKKCVIDKFIKEKDYRICPEGCRLELITPRPNAIYECKIDTPVKAKQIQELNLSTLPDRSPRAGGALIFARKLMKITFMKYLDGTEEVNEPTLLPESELQPDPVAAPDQEAGTAVKKEEKVPVKEKKAASPASEKEKNGDDEEENWGILQPDLGF